MARPLFSSTMEKATGVLILQKHPKKRVIPVALLLFATFSYSLTYLLWSPSSLHTEIVPRNAATIVAQCQALQLTPGPPDNFHSRKQSDRFVQGTKPTI